ncbi:conserved oligomeric Golgi complex subunit 7 [Ischnura elegans]|uniref:conserved oligomeric Golgi complex subunit 7 n=1 Tax=Ischnura elegans TaxID=197161 RepID=UPI001ED89B46|nr:conserved oligomeric Golgi complex subunit 7 [Ischnura elegans]
MDISSFSADNFDMKTWINETLRNADSEENLENVLSTLVMKLQLYVQQVNSALEDTSQQVLQNLPRVVRDTETLQREAITLGEKMKIVKEEICKVEQDTGQSMVMPERLDRLKTKMLTAKQALHEADNWTALSADLEEVFESGDMESIASKLVSMQQSLNILANAPDSEDRKLQLEELKNRLEALASPPLVQALTSSSLEDTRRFVRIFKDMDRLDRLPEYYHKCHRSFLLQKWLALVESEQDDGMANLLHKFYDLLISNWDEQAKWCGKAFSPLPPGATLTRIYVDILGGRGGTKEPGPAECVDAALRRLPANEHLSFLLRLSESTARFSADLSAAITRTCKDCLPSDDLLLSLACAIQTPYVSHVARYSQLEQAVIFHQLSNLHRAGDDISEYLHSLLHSIPRVFSVADEAHQRCLRFTHGCGFPGLVSALGAYFENYINLYGTLLTRLRVSRSSNEDWNVFQMYLTLLQSVGDLLSHLKDLDAELTQSLLNSSKELMQASEERKDPFLCYDVLLLTTSGQKELNDIIESAQQGSPLLVQPMTTAQNLWGEVYSTTLGAIYTPIEAHLKQVSKFAPSEEIVRRQAGPDVPDFGYAPQEYITQIGQYLMTLPQHLEPFLSRDHATAGTPPWSGCSELLSAIDGSDGVVGGLAEALLSGVARATCKQFSDLILGLHSLGPDAARQLATDIDYLGNVLEELGLVLSEPLRQVASLLRLPAEDYLTGSTGCAPRIVAAVRQLRNLPSTS